MTAEQMAYEFQLNYELDNLDAPGLNDQEVSTFLTNAQEEIVKTKYYPLSNRFLRGFDMDEKRRKDLSELIRSVDIDNSNISSDQTGVHANGVYWNLPIDFYLPIQEEATVSSLDCNGNNKRVNVKPKSFDIYNEDIKNPFKKPFDELVWRTDYSRELGTSIKRHELITDGTYSINTYHLHYLSRPRPIIVPTSDVFTIDGYTSTSTLDCLLDEGVHREIVKSAVRIAVSIYKQEEYQVKTIEEQRSE